MAGPSIVVQVLADLKSFTNSVGATGKTAETAANKMHGAFSGMLGALNATGVLGPFQGALDSIDQGLSALSAHGKTTGLVLLGVGTAVAGVGAGLSAIGSKEQASHQQLQAAVAATGKSYDDYADRVEAAIKHQEKFGHTAVDTQDAIRILTQATGDTGKAIDEMGTAADLAAAKHESLSAAASQLAKVHGGANRILKEFGITAEKAGDNSKAMAAAEKAVVSADAASAAAKQHLADIEAIDATKKHLTTAEAIQLRDAQQKVSATAAIATEAHRKLADMHATVTTKAGAANDAIGQLSDKLKGQASASANTFMGRLDAMKAKLEDTVSKFGTKYGPAITALGSAMAGLGAAMEIITALGPVMGAALDLALGPVGLVILAVAAMAAAAYLVYRNWDTLLRWFKADWQYLLLFFIGPFALAIRWIVDHWSEIVAFFKTTFDTIKGIVSDVVGPIIGFFESMVAPVKTVVETIVGIFVFMGKVLFAIGEVLAIPYILAFEAISYVAGIVVKAIIDGWNFLYKTLAWIAGLLAGPFNAAWAAIAWAAGVAVGVIIDGWNYLYKVLAWIAGLLAGPFNAAWAGIAWAAGIAIGVIENLFSGLYATLRWVSGVLGGIFSGMWSGMTEAFRAAINGIIDIWNALHFPGINIGPFHTPDIGAPHINHLAAGGIVTSPTLALIGERGPEAVVPLGQGLRTGPAVHIEHATFTEPVDVELFMRQAAWLVRTRSA